MTRPRSQLVSPETTPYYHCISRCVRRAFLCGKDRFSGRSFDHRKPWLVERLSLLVSVFAIDLAAYAVMSNHYHLVLHIDEARAKAWSDDEVISRWTQLFKGPLLIQQFQAGTTMTSAELDMVKELVRYFRKQLCSLSKFMACLNYYIACKANLEDGCTGRFWEGRFKSQALLDETALLSCMAYVDLNPVRAGIANDLERSDFTSAQERISQVRAAGSTRKTKQSDYRRPRLLPFRERLRNDDTEAAIPFNLKDYLGLTEWTGRSVRADKRGSIQMKHPKLLVQLGLSDTQWLVLALDIQKQSFLMLHGLDTLHQIKKRAAKRQVA